ncbi:toll/interleukin-1 receptor domain-containing protein [Halopseudomonas sp.]|uniref:toll/interleukin-1 receptor domain-containing protein n=1 Tax=Halopseudomonas sp. TaxID=2901191 RepID=UPI00311DD925
MPVFISYSHVDKAKVDLIAGHLVRKRTSVWVDRWELKAGDSIINKVQEAVEGSSALLIMLSKASVESEWCKKELTAGLFRELDEKRVVVVPVLLEDCKIPLFLRDKMYADFRADFDEGMHTLLESVAQFSNGSQSRIDEADGSLDWSVDWGMVNGSYFINYTIVQTSNTLQMSFLTEIICLYNEVATRRQQKFDAADIGWIGRTTNAVLLLDYAERVKDEMFVVLESSTPENRKFAFHDSKTRTQIDILVKCRKMGNDNGKDQLINITEYFRKILKYVSSVEREATTEELARFEEIRSMPW